MAGARHPRKLTQRLIASRPLAFLLYLLIRVYAWTLRFRAENEEPWRAHLESGGAVVICTWHQHFFSAIRHFKSYSALRPSLMISRSRDGDIIANVASLSGWIPVRGSSSRGGKEALAEMVSRLRESRFVGHVVDGPRGPAGIVKPGLIRLAHAGNATIFPFYVTAEKAWYANSWDRFFLPKPFSRVTLRFGAGIEVEPTEDPEVFEAQRLRVEATMRQEAGMLPLTSSGA